MSISGNHPPRANDASSQPYYLLLMKNCFRDRMEKNRNYSLRAFARSFLMDSGAIAQILNGTRIPSEKAAKQIARNLDLNPDEERDFFLSLAQIHSSRGLKKKSRFFVEILESSTGPKSNLSPTGSQLASLASHQYQDLSMENFRAIADWYHYAILELTLTKGYRSDVRWIASQLGITFGEANLACERLLQLGYLEMKRGKMRKATPPLLTMDRDRTSSALKRRHRQVLDKASVALDEVSIEARNHTAMTLAIDPAKIPEAKKRIQNFLDELTAFLESGERTVVYETIIDLFPLQKVNPPERTP